MDVDEAAHALGMKNREIRDIEEVDDGHVVTTHDGQRVHVDDDGATRPWSGPTLGAAAPTARPSGRTSRQPRRAVTQAPADPGQAPDGTVDEVLKWVGTDRDRAGVALAAEQTRPEQRATLVTALEKLTQ